MALFDLEKAIRGASSAEKSVPFERPIDSTQLYILLCPSRGFC